MFDEILESPMFWFLGGGAVTAEVLGWMAAKRGFMGLEQALPLWQLLILIAGSLVAAAFFALKE